MTILALVWLILKIIIALGLVVVLGFVVWFLLCVALSLAEDFIGVIRFVFRRRTRA